MNKRYIWSIVMSVCMMTSVIYADKLVDTFKQLSEPGALFIALKEEKQKRLQELRVERTDVNRALSDFKKDINKKIQHADEEIQHIEEQLATDADNERLKKRKEVLIETEHVLKDMLRERMRLHGLYDEAIRVYTTFLEDPEFTEFIRRSDLTNRLYYSFDELQRMYDLILDYDRRVNKFSEEQKSVRLELENRKRAAEATQELYKEIVDNLRRVQDEKKQVSITDEQDVSYDLVKEKEDLYTHKKLLDDILVKESKIRLEVVDLELLIAKEQLSILKSYMRRIKPLIRVSNADIASAQEHFEQEQKEYYHKKDVVTHELDGLLEKEKELERQQDRLSRRYGLDVTPEIEHFVYDGTKTVESFVAWSELGRVSTELRLVQRKIELLNVQLELEYEQFMQAQMALKIKRSYHKITSRSFVKEDDIASEIKQYERPKIEAQSKLRSYKEKITLVADHINEQKKALDNLAKMQQMIEQEKDALFADHKNDFLRCEKALDQARIAIQDQITLFGKLPSLYSGITATLEAIVRLVDFIVRELESITIWYRPEYAITWQGIVNIIPDVVTFLSDTRSYVTRFTTHYLHQYIYDSLKDVRAITLFILLLFLIALIAYAIRKIVPWLIHGIMTFSYHYGGAMRRVSLVFAMILGFIDRHLWMISFLCGTFVCMWWYQIVDPYMYGLYYLFLLPFFLYLAQRFFAYFMQFNREHNYILLRKDFERRWLTVMSLLAYTTIFIVFFRQAFMSNYYKSELPDMLLAVNFIIFQISLIFLLTKEQILNVIPTNTDFWSWIYSLVDRYYYLLLTAVVIVIIMSNPYVGFGRLVLYMLFGFIYTIILFMSFMWLYTLCKRVLMRLFFSSSEDIIKERFSNAKTWFGLSLISVFVLFGILGLMIAAKIWGWPIDFSDVATWIQEPLLLKDTTSPLSVISLFKLLLVLFGGFIIAYLVNRFVLERIFDLLLIDAGVQHTVVSISQYVIIITAAFIGFQSIGLGDLVRYIMVSLIFGIGFILREPISDFMAYFVILVQRPIKIGDYIRIDDDTMGVVRKITARAVILRRKNSTTIIVPNSKIIARGLQNWNYTTNFVAFDDIYLTVDFREDPAVIKALMLSVLENYPKILKNPKPIVRLNDFGKFGFTFMIRGYVSSGYTLDLWDIASDVRITIVEKLRSYDIKLATPWRQIDYRSETIIQDNDESSEQQE